MKNYSFMHNFQELVIKQIFKNSLLYFSMNHATITCGDKSAKVAIAKYDVEEFTSENLRCDVKLGEKFDSAGSGRYVIFTNTFSNSLSDFQDGFYCFQFSHHQCSFDTRA